jgi:hypothetical protein
VGLGCPPASIVTALRSPVPIFADWTVGDKYIVRLIYDTEAAFADPTVPPRTSFEILPRATAEPQPMAGWQRITALVLLALTAGSTLQSAIAANIGLLPKVCGWVLVPGSPSPVHLCLRQVIKSWCNVCRRPCCGCPTQQTSIRSFYHQGSRITMRCP